MRRPRALACVEHLYVLMDKTLATAITVLPPSKLPITTQDSLPALGRRGCSLKRVILMSLSMPSRSRPRVHTIHSLAGKSYKRAEKHSHGKLRCIHQGVLHFVDNWASSFAAPWLYRFFSCSHGAICARLWRLYAGTSTIEMLIFRSRSGPLSQR